MLALLYDIHGNLVALEGGAEGRGGRRGRRLSPRRRLRIVFAVAARDDRTAARTTEHDLDSRQRRALAARAAARPAGGDGGLQELDAGLGTYEGLLYSLQAQFERDGVLYVHGSPLSDVESFPPEPGEDDERMLNGVRDKTVVFGHSHQQFRRPGPNGTTLINPGSVGMPLDGDVRSAYALRSDAGEFEFRRVEYDVERVAQAWEKVGGDFAKFAAQRVRRGSD